MRPAGAGGGLWRDGGGGKKGRGGKRERKEEEGTRRERRGEQEEREKNRNGGKCVCKSVSMCECARVCAGCGMVSPPLQTTGLAHSPMKARPQVDSRLSLLIYYSNHLELAVNSTSWSDPAFQHLKQTLAFNPLYSMGPLWYMQSSAEALLEYGAWLCLQRQE